MASMSETARVARVGTSIRHLHNDKIGLSPLEGAVNGGNARSRAIFLGKCVEQGLSAGLVQQVVDTVLDESSGLSRPHEVKVICFTPLGSRVCR